VEVTVPTGAARIHTVVHGVTPATHAGRWLVVRAAGGR
jgi:hypothetical protein